MFMVLGIFFSPLSYNILKNQHLRIEAIPERKKMFFQIVEAGLSDRFNENETLRITKFCSFTKQEINLPSNLKYLHEPCEEVSRNLYFGNNFVVRYV